MLVAHAGDEPVDTATGMHLPLWHRHTGVFTAAHSRLHALAPGLLTGAGHAGDLLGDPVVAWTQLAASSDGAAAACRLLAALTAHTPRRPGPDDAPLEPTARIALEAAARWWTTMPDADLSPGTLADAADFADAAVPDEVWLRWPGAAPPASWGQTHGDDIAARAAAHLFESDACFWPRTCLPAPLWI
ncbi:hypothetical protein QFZ75_008128 [Streptomyces sp. V3I8]|uniref:hypothetical protein n=1 Tax=Streptomyces sp. V3I8 TaxID=3042279 RepID=UPI00278578E8|nr:hypothetical protein [Streptomyces sp. V3I8]MDQ1041626.1 hypothetical protein [Streptomyces sp. V3I8]